MKRIPIILLIAAIMLTGGCVDIDWQKTAKETFAALLEQVMKVAVDEFRDKKMEAVSEIKEWAEGLDWAWPILKHIDYEGLIEVAYDRIWATWYTDLREAGYYTDDFVARKNKLWYITGRQCPGLHDELVGMMQVE